MMTSGLTSNLTNFDPFLATLSPGTGVILQYDCQPPAFGIFQGFQGGFVLLSNFNGFPGLTRIRANRINAVSPFTGFFPFPTPFFGGFNQFPFSTGFNQFPFTGGFNQFPFI
jgi:hypothetical protein